MPRVRAASLSTLVKSKSIELKSNSNQQRKVPALNIRQKPPHIPISDRIPPLSLYQTEIPLYQTIDKKYFPFILGHHHSGAGGREEVWQEGLQKLEQRGREEATPSKEQREQ